MKHIAKFLIRLYQRLFSPILGNNCRFHPTCSDYSIESFDKHGFLKGLWLSSYRVVRCNPFNKGGIDDVPEHFVFFQSSKHKGNL